MLRRHSLQNIPSRGVKTAATGPERVPGAGGGASQQVMAGDGCSRTGAGRRRWEGRGGGGFDNLHPAAKMKG